MSLLEVRGVTLRFGGIAALDQVSFSVQRGEVVAIVGPASAVPKVRVNGRSEDVIFFDGVFFESSLKSIFFAS